MIKNKIRILRAKIENKIFEVYFKAFRKAMYAKILRPEDYKQHYQVSLWYTENYQIIKGAK